MFETDLVHVLVKVSENVQGQELSQGADESKHFGFSAMPLTQNTALGEKFCVRMDRMSPYTMQQT